MGNSGSDLNTLAADLLALRDTVELSKFVAASASSAQNSSPKATVMHVRLQENVPNVQNLARYLWTRAANYALSRKRRLELREQIEAAPKGDVSLATLIVDAARDAFLEFRKAYPNRASEVGELLAYCIAIEQLNAAQLAAKMSLKTNSNMPVHGLDGIHAIVKDGCLYIYFLESKLSRTASAGAADFAKSVAEFSSNKKQYRREYSIVRDLGNFDTLDAESRSIALRHFDVFASPDDVEKRERFVGVVLYSDPKTFDSLPPPSDAHPPGHHEKLLSSIYAQQLDKHQKAALKQLTSKSAQPHNCIIYFVAVPDTGELRTLFYEAMGYVPKGAK